MQKICFFISLFLICILASAQMAEIDSLKGELRKYKVKDSLYVDLLNELGFLYSRSSQDSSSAYISRAMEISKSLNYEKGLVRSKVLQGNNLTIQGLSEEALAFYLEAITLGARKYPLEYIRTTNNLGELYRRKEILDSSISYFLRAKQTAETELPEAKPIIILSNLGEVYLMKGEIDTAAFYFEACLKNANESNNLVGLGYAYFGLAEVAFQKQRFQSAIAKQSMSISYRDSANHIRGITQSFLQMGEYYFALSRLDSAAFYWEEAQKMASSNGFIDLLTKAYLKRYMLSLKKENFTTAGQFLQKFEKLSDSVRSRQFAYNAERIQKSLETELIQKENEILRKEKEVRATRERTRLTSILLILLVVVGAAYSLYKLRKKELAIRERSKENQFTESLLNLARRLNRSEFDINDFVKKLLEDSQGVLKSHRASYWIQDPQSTKLSLQHLVESEDAAEVTPIVFEEDDLPSFFEDFLAQRTVSFSSLSNETKLDTNYREFFRKSGIESILNAPIHVAGKFFGFISYSMTRKELREWDMQEHRYVGSLADLLVSAIEKNRANQLEREKVVLIEKLKQQNDSLNEFNSVISHNLREPLTQIIGLTNILLADDGKLEIQSEVIQHIALASNKVDKVIRELSIVLNDHEPTANDFTQVSLPAMIKEVHSLLQHEINEQPVNIQQQLEVTKLITFKPFLLDILYHLLSNCIKYRAADRALVIQINSSQGDGKLILAIADNGRGIDLQKVGKKLFKMYQRYHLDVEGRGVGLYIVSNRLNALNGSIEVKSTPDKGSTFIIKLPIQ